MGREQEVLDVTDANGGVRRFAFLGREIDRVDRRLTEEIAAVKAGIVETARAAVESRRSGRTWAISVLSIVLGLLTAVATMLTIFIHH